MRLSIAVALLLVVLAALPARAKDDVPPPPLTTEVVLDASPREAWDVFATSEGWKALGVAKAEVDFRVGGKIRSHYDPAGVLGDEGTIENTILAFEPERMLAFRATKAPKGFPFPAEVLDRTWNVTTFTDLGDGRTRLTLRGYGYGSDEASRKMRDFFEKGNATTLQGLVARFAKGRDAADPALAPIEASAVYDGSPADAFRAWSTSEGLGGALGTTVRVRLEVGGPFEIEFDGSRPPGERGSEGCTVLSWLPGRMLSFTWNAPPKFAAARAQRTVVVVEMEAEGPGRTVVRLTHHGFAEKAAADAEHAAEWREVRAYFARAWPRFLTAVGASLAGR
jgi:uncharacterized protein YndB with AHSA1/START domain